MKRLKTVQLISPSGPYGAESMMLNLAHGLAKLSCESILAVFDNSRNSRLEIVRMAVAAGLPVEVIPCRGKFNLQVFTQLKRFFKRHSIDVVHSHGLKTDVYALMAARAAHLPLVSTYHSGSEAWRTNFKLRSYRELNLQILRRYDKVVAVSPTILQNLRASGLSSHILRQIPNGIHVDRYEQAPPAKDIQACGNVVIGYVGRLIREKGVQHLLHAAKAVLQRFPDAGFCVVGSGPYREFLETLCKDLNIANRVLFTGVRDDMPSVYNALDIVVLPSYNEGLPMAVLEGLAAKRAVIATDVGGIPGLIKDGHTGLLIPSKETDSLETAINRLIDSSNLRHRLGDNGWSLVKDTFSSEKMAGEYFSLYQDILSKRAAA